MEPIFIWRSILMVVVLSFPLFFTDTVYGAIEFNQVSNYQVSAGTRNVSSFDLDNDSDNDLVTTDYINDTISFLYNEGGSITHTNTIHSGGPNPDALAFADFDHDGDIDIAVANFGEPAYLPRAQIGGIAVFSNNGGNFELSYYHRFDTATSNPVSIIASDLDGDGYDDLVVTQDIKDSVSIFRNNSNFTFTQTSVLSIADQPRNVLAADFDSDGDNDLAVTSWHGDSLTILLNNNGNFSTYSIMNFGRPEEMTATDFDHDGDIDLAFEAQQYLKPTSIHILKNDGNANFSLLQRIDNQTFSSITHADYDNDGDVDIAVNGSEINTEHISTGQINIFANDSNGNFSLSKKVVIGNSIDNNKPVSFVNVDFNNDGMVDIITANQPSGNLSFALQKLSNTPPTFMPISDKTTNEDTQLQFAVSATDTNPTDILTYSATGLPAGATFDPQTQTFSWTPGYNDAGTYNVTFTVSDNGNPVLTDSKTVAITVENTNRAPALTPIGNKTVNEGESLEFTLSATDPDGDTLTYTTANLPQGATFNPSTRMFSWTPGYGDAGNYNDIEFTVIDNGTPIELAVELITITVGNVNRAPTFVNPGPQEVLETKSLSFNVTAVDPDGDSLIISSTNLPQGATFNGATFNWTPNLTQSGVYTVSFTAIDSGIPTESALLEIVITVGDNPTPTEQAANIITDVIDLTIPQNVENSYLANLQKVGEFILDGKIQAAINQLQAFITKVNQDYQKKILNLAERDDLLTSAQKLIADLTN